ncbi:MAG: D-glycero-alpha-D-manno-heptose-1,7-bisphosphate 7-phosphatase [Myxococcota bacterium]
MRRWAFLDRDGTLIEDRKYSYALADYAPLPGVYDAVRELRAAGFGVAIVTNQSGIGRGYFGEADFTRFQSHLLADFAAHDAALDASYHCPHRPDEGCDCRKPRPGLLLRAAREHSIDFARSWVIGNEESDVALAGQVGCRAVRIGGGERADRVAVASDLLDAVRRWVLAADR